MIATTQTVEAMPMNARKEVDMILVAVEDMAAVTEVMGQQTAVMVLPLIVDMALLLTAQGQQATEPLLRDPTHQDLTLEVG